MAYGGNGDRGPFLNTINWVFNAIAVGMRIFFNLFSMKGIYQVQFADRMLI